MSRLWRRPWPRTSPGTKRSFSRAERPGGQGGNERESADLALELFVLLADLGARPAGVSFAGTAPVTRSMTHLRTRMLSPYPGHMNFPLSSVRNQLTEKIL